jgi:glycine/D-amino acid oxidase-like deaminating enzyme
MFELAAAAAEQLKRSHPELGAQLEVVRSSDDDTSSSSKLASLRVPSACGAIIQKKAASLWPYKLVASVLESLLARFPAPSFNLQTNTPATSLSRSETGSGWVVATPRGSITARQVLLATNGYTSHLLPAFADLIVPVRGQIGALIPPTSSSGTPPVKLTHSYVFAAEPDPTPNPGHGAQHSLTAAATSAAAVAPRDDYLVQRPLLPSGGGEFIYGGGRRFARNLGVGQWRDDEIEEDVARYLRANLAPPLDLASSSSPSLVGGTKEEEGVEGKHELKASFQWTGVMGYSRDAHAWVGPVPESLGGGGPRGGLYVCAGYTGHGMPAAALSAREVARLMVESATMAEGCGVDEEKEEEEEEEGKKGGVRLPEEFKLTEQRVARAKALPELTQGWEATNFAALISGVVP